MNLEEELEYIKNLLKQYVDVAKEEYSDFANRREHKYTYTKENGKKVLGSHPKAIDYHIEELQDSVYSADKEEIAKDIINDSNITEEYTQAVKELSAEGRQRLLDEVIKAEIELLYYDKSRNESRTSHDKIQNTYIPNEISAQNIAYSQFNTIKETIMEAKAEEEQKYKLKTKEEVFSEYLDEVRKEKANLLDKVIQPIKTFLQSAEHNHLVDYKILDYEIFFNALIYTPKYLYEKSKFYKEYSGNYVQVAEDFKESLEGEENLVSDFIQSDKLDSRLQSKKNVEEKYNEINNFLDYCKDNDYIKKNYLRGNRKFSVKKFDGILKNKRKRQPFNNIELNLMFTKLTKSINTTDTQNILIPIISLFSGLRVEEICKLRVEDIKEENDIYYFDINGLVKTENSIRKVPIHSQLIDKFKFLDFVKKRKNEKEEMLFNLKSVYHKGKLKYSHYFLRDYFYNFRDSFITQERIEIDLVSFHSFRHTFATKLDAGRVDLFAISNLLGHGVDTVAQVFFNIKIKENETPNYIKQDLRKLKEDLEKLELSDLQENINNCSIAYINAFL